MARDNDRQESVAEKNGHFSRRRWLQVFGAGSAGLVAGCGGTGNPGGDDTDTPVDDTDTPVDDTNTPTETDTPTPRPTVTDPRDDTLNWVNSYSKERHGYNGFNPATGSIQERQVMSSNLARFDVSENTWVARAAEDWSISQEEATVTLSDEYGWSNGDPVTAEDLYTQTGLSFYRPGEREITTGVEIVEGGPGGTVKWTQNSGYNMSVLTRTRLDTALLYPESVYGEWLTQLKDATSSDEKESVWAELEKWTYKPTLIGGNHEPEEILSSGPFYMSEMTNKRIVMKPNPHHPVGKSYRFGMSFRWSKDTNAEKPMMKSNATDVSREDLSPQFLETLPNNWWTVYYPAYGGNSIDFLLDHDLYGNRNVRRALNFMVDQEQVGKANPTPSTPVKHHTGMADFIAEAWLSDDLLSSMSKYGQDYDKATSLLEDEGFTQDGSTWKTPDGEDWKVQIELPAGDTNRVKETEVAVQHMKDFGLDANIKISEVGTYWSTYRSGDWPSGIKFWAFGDRGRPHPIYDYQYAYIGGSRNEDTSEDPVLSWNHMPWNVEVPYPIGDTEGDLEEVDFYELISSISDTTTREQEEEKVRECAWVWNQFMPKLPTTNTMRMSHFTDDDWRVPEEDYVKSIDGGSKISNSIREGRLTAKPK